VIVVAIWCACGVLSLFIDFVCTGTEWEFTPLWAFLTTMALTVVLGPIALAATLYLQVRKR
jgi:hypothetical protein